MPRKKPSQPGPHSTDALPDLPRMSRAIAHFLNAARIPTETTELRETPKRAAQAWAETFLDGYQLDPSEFFAETYPAGDNTGIVLVKNISFHGMCPHHLLPFRGSAHVAYQPAKKLASFSAITRLVDCFSHRLEIQEVVTRQIAETLSTHLKTKGTAVVVETDQSCLTMRDARRRGTRTITEHYTGIFLNRSELRTEFLGRLSAFD